MTFSANMAESTTSLSRPENALSYLIRQGLGWSLVALIWWAAAHGVDNVGFDLRFLAWDLYICSGYFAITHCLFRPLVRSLRARLPPPPWRYPLLLALPWAGILVLAAMEYLWFYLNGFSFELLAEQLPRKMLFHGIFLYAWLLCYQLAWVRRQTTDNIELAEKPRIYVLAQLGGWSIAGLLWYVLVVSGPLADSDTLWLLSWILLVCCVSLLLSHFVLRSYFQASADRPGGVLKKSLQLILLTLLCALMIMVAEAIWIPITGFGIRSQSGAQFLVVFAIKQGFFLFWSLVYLSWLASRQKELAETKRLLLEVAYQEAQLSGLKQQLNPHFLFNTLNSIRAMIIKDQNIARTMVSSMSNLLRYSLYLGEQNTLPLSRELEIVEEYLALEKIRYGERLRAGFALDNGLMDIPVLPMSLQTLVENAIKHNIQRTERGISLTIGAQRQGQELRLWVENEGQLQSEDSGGLGLKNIRQRLKLIFGDAAELSLTSPGENRVLAQMRYPSPGQATESPQ
ncbi:sensor histidine kinase [Shewanella sedimentimangrovi]|uniref:Histidine kinase n=1 Tax=Shewanella sedimentimangrovi TaxID=2814293 RepID=A0ABX7QWR7_9GAMM|nr:histidine kinase [Shewanella sedimentimangrovi]QSX35674.1 histidine kinase [Shewanella sedimentimangrovi]